MDRLGKLIREARDSKGETLKEMAKAIKCSEAFARHIESSQSVPISDRLIQACIAHFKLPKVKTIAAAKERYTRGRSYYRKWNAKQA